MTDSQAPTPRHLDPDRPRVRLIRDPDLPVFVGGTFLACAYGRTPAEALTAALIASIPFLRAGASSARLGVA